MAQTRAARATARKQGHTSPKKWLRSSGCVPPNDSDTSADNDDAMDEDQEMTDTVSPLRFTKNRKNRAADEDPNRYLTPHSSLTSNQIEKLQLAPKRRRACDVHTAEQESPHALHGASPWISVQNQMPNIHRQARLNPPRSPIPRCTERIGPPRHPMWDAYSSNKNNSATHVSRIDDYGVDAMKNAYTISDANGPNGPDETSPELQRILRQRGLTGDSMNVPSRPTRMPGYSPNGFPLSNPTRENKLLSPFSTPTVPFSDRVYHLPSTSSSPSPTGNNPPLLQPDLANKAKVRHPNHVLHYRRLSSTGFKPAALGPNGTHLVFSSERTSTSITARYQREPEYYFTQNDIEELFEEAKTCIKAFKLGLKLPAVEAPHGMHLADWEVVLGNQQQVPRKLGPHGTHLVVEPAAVDESRKFKTVNQMMDALGYERVNAGDDYAYENIL